MKEERRKEEKEIKELKELISKLMDEVSQKGNEIKKINEDAQKEKERSDLLENKILALELAEQRRDKEIVELKAVILNVREEMELNVNCIDEFDRQMQHFQREMKKTKAGWKEKWQTMEKKNIKWKWTANDGY